MFATKNASIGLPAAEAHRAGVWCEDGIDDLVYLITVDGENTGWVEEDRQILPDLESVAPGPLLESIDRSRLNGFDLVRVLGARERLISHCQAGSVADVHEIAYAAPGDSGSDVDRLDEPSRFAADELRPALTLTRRAAEYRMSVAFDLRERLPGVWHMLHDGVIDLGRAR